MYQNDKNSDPSISLKCAVESISPAIARHYIQSNTKNNRTPKNTWVKKFASAMRQGRWTLSGPIVFDVNGTIIDGQTRLYAVIEAGVAVDFVVCRGYPTASVSGFDQNRPRGAADLAKMSGQGDIPGYQIATVNCLNYDLESVSDFRGKLGRPLSEGEKLVVRNHFSDFFEWFEKSAGGSKTRITKNAGVVATILKAWHQCNHERLKEFICVVGEMDGSNSVDVTEAAKEFRIWYGNRSKNDREGGGKSAQISTMRRCQHALDLFLRKRPLNRAPQAIQSELFPIRSISCILEKTDALQEERQEAIRKSVSPSVDRPVKYFKSVKDCLKGYAKANPHLIERTEQELVQKVLSHPSTFDENTVKLIIIESAEKDELLSKILDFRNLIGACERDFVESFAKILITRLIKEGLIRREYEGIYISSHSFAAKSIGLDVLKSYPLSLILETLGLKASEQERNALGLSVSRAIRAQQLPINCRNGTGRYFPTPELIGFLKLSLNP